MNFKTLIAGLFLACASFAQSNPPATMWQAYYLPNYGALPLSTYEGGPIYDSYPVILRRVPPQWAHRLVRVQLELEPASTTQPGDWRARIENLSTVPILGYPPVLGWYIFGVTQYWYTWLPTTVPSLVSRPDLTVYGSGQSRGTGNYLPSRSATDGADWAGLDYWPWASAQCNEPLVFFRVNITSPAKLRRFMSRTSEYVTPLYISPRDASYYGNWPSDVRLEREAIARCGPAVRCTYFFQ